MTETQPEQPDDTTDTNAGDDARSGGIVDPDVMKDDDTDEKNDKKKSQ
jgi:hypothetical protein